MNKIILASQSPRRKELLEREGIDFIVDASAIEENMDLSLSVEERLMKLASDKAAPIHLKYPDDIVIGADTIVYHHDEIIGKAKDEKDARKILNQLSDDMHCVYTAVAIYDKDDLITFVDCTKVYFKDIKMMIDEYITSHDWWGKAGAYGIQTKGHVFVDHIEGDIDTVIGLPVKKIVAVIKKIQQESR